MAMVMNTALGLLVDQKLRKHSDANKGTISVQVERYYLENDSYPAATADITDEEDYFPNGAPECPGGGTYAIDDTTGIVTCTIH
jgi:hypothetical protein